MYIFDYKPINPNLEGKMAKQGSSKALSDPKRNKELVKQMTLTKSPAIMESYFKFIKDNIDGVKDFDQYDKDGNITDDMSPSSRDRMKLANKMATNVFNKMLPTTLSIETTSNDSASMNPELQEAIMLLAGRARAAAEMENEQDNALNEDQAREIRTIARSEER